MGNGFKISCFAITFIAGWAYMNTAYIQTGRLSVHFSILSFVVYGLIFSMASLLFFHLESLKGEKPTMTMGEKMAEKTEESPFVIVVRSKKELDNLDDFLLRENHDKITQKEYEARNRTL
jgi:hypothetical protein